MQTLLSREQNPFFEHGDAEFFLAERAGEIVGRIAGVENRLHNETHHDRTGFFGFFESVDDQAVADALFEAAAEWLRGRKFSVMRGHASYSVYEEFGLLIHGFETPPTLMMPHNPRYYQALVERAGFIKAKDLFTYEGVDPNGGAGTRIERGARLIAERYGIRIRMLETRRLEQELGIVKRILNLGWEQNWGAMPVTDHEIEHVAKSLRPVLVPELIPFAEKDGEPIGFAWAMPDLNETLRYNRNGAFLPGLVRVLWALKARRLTRLRVLLLGVLPEWKGRGIDALLYHHIWQAGNARGIHWGEAGWILEDNPAMNAGMLKLGFTRHKIYRVYDRPL